MWEKKRLVYLSNLTCNEILSFLAAFDFDQSNALRYSNRLSMGPTTVYSLSLESNLEKTKVYRSLRKMQNLGIVTTTFSNPTRCYAVEPQTALTKIIERKKDEIISMQKMLDGISQSITQTKEMENSETQSSAFVVIQGRSNIYSRIGRVIEDSVDTVYLVTTQDDITRMSYTTIPDRIKRCKEKGGKVILITNTDRRSMDDVIDLNASEVRITQLPSKSRLVATRNHLIMSGNINDSMSLNDVNDSVFYTNVFEIIINMLNYCTHLYETSEPLKLQKCTA